MIRRSFIFLICCVALVGCATQQLPPDVAQDIYLAETRIDTSKLGSETGGRKVPVSQLKAALEREVRLRIKNRGNRTVRLDIDVTSANIVTAGQSILVGGSSHVTATVSVVDYNTGEVLMAPTQVRGTGGGYAPGGIIGALALPDRNTDVQNIAKGFAENLNIVLFGQ